MRDNILFNSYPWYEYSQGILGEVRTKAKNLSKDVFEANSIEHVVEHIASQYTLEPLHTYPEQKTQDIVETIRTVDYPLGSFGISDYDDDRTVQIPSYRVVVELPFSGSEELWRVSPTTRQMNRASADISSNQLTFSVETEQSSATAESIENAVLQKIAEININVGHVNNDISGFNKSVREVAATEVQKRFEQVSKLDSIKMALKIPLEKTTNPSPLNQVKINVQKIAPLSTKKEEPGGTISSDDYEAIIETIRSMGASMESNRASEARDEESLRDMLLVGLSASIKGGAVGGELFHKSGKTDISIPFDNKATFVAECKLWKGEVYVNEGITQLLGYTTWRDAKTVLVIFNKDNKDFSAIQGQIEGIFNQRKDYVRTIGQREGEWRFVLIKPDDNGRQIEIHVLLFDVPR